MNSHTTVVINQTDRPRAYYDNLIRRLCVARSPNSSLRMTKSLVVV